MHIWIIEQIMIIIVIKQTETCYIYNEIKYIINIIIIVTIK